MTHEVKRSRNTTGLHLPRGELVRANLGHAGPKSAGLKTGDVESKLFEKSWQGHRARDWRRRISDNIAFGLLAYTALQIFVTMKQLKELNESLLPYLALVMLVAAIIPACRRLERRWDRLSDAQAGDPALAPLFRRDRALIWLGAIGLPFIFAGVARLLYQITA